MDHENYKKKKTKKEAKKNITRHLQYSNGNLRCHDAD
jgi:hypothetical protein